MFLLFRFQIIFFSWILIQLSIATPLIALPNENKSSTNSDNTSQQIIESCKDKNKADINECQKAQCDNLNNKDQLDSFTCRMNLCNSDNNSQGDVGDIGDVQSDTKKCYRSTIDEYIDGQQGKNLSYSLVEKLASFMVLLHLGHLLLTIIAFGLNKTLFANNLHCVFISHVIGKVGAAISNVMLIASIIIFIKDIHDLKKKFDNISDSDDMQAKVFSYLIDKNNILKKHTSIKIVHYTISITLSSIALAAAILEYSQGLGFCPATPEITKINQSNNIFDIALHEIGKLFYSLNLTAIADEGTNIKENTNQLSDLGGYVKENISNVEKNVSNNLDVISRDHLFPDSTGGNSESFISNLIGKIGISINAIGKYILFGTAIYFLGQLVYNLYKIASYAVKIPQKVWTTGSKAQLTTGTAIGRSFISLTKIGIKVTLLVLTAVIRSKLSNREKLLKDIQSKLGQQNINKTTNDYYKNKMKLFLQELDLSIKSSYAEIENLNIQNKIAISKKSDSNINKNFNKDFEKSSNICLSANLAIDINCLCAKNNSCYKFDIQNITKTVPIAKSYTTLLEHLNISMSGKKNIFDYNQTDVMEMTTTIPLIKQSMAIFDTQLRVATKNESNSNAYLLHFKNNIDKKELMKYAFIEKIISPASYFKFVPFEKNLFNNPSLSKQIAPFIGEIDKNESKNEDKNPDTNQILTKNDASPQPIDSKTRVEDLPIQGITEDRIRENAPTYIYDSYEKDSHVDIWQVISARHQKRFHDLFFETNH